VDLKSAITTPFKVISNIFVHNRQIEVKVNNPSVPMGLPLYPTGDKPILYSTEAILYYLECAPVQTAIDKITDEIAAIKPLVYNPDKDEYIDNHPILDLLKYPDADFVWSEFIKQLANFYLITGNSYIKADGFIEQPPLSLRVMPSQAVSIVVGFDGYPQNITARVMSLMDTYNRQEVDTHGQIRFRFYANDLKELYQIRTFNPMVSSNMGYGLSPLNAIFYEMRQYVEVAKYNLSALQRGVKLSGYLKSKIPLPDARKQEFLQQMSYGFAGSNNAGRMALFENDMEFVDTMKNSRDMDYIEMREQVTKSIYNALKIPLPLIDSETSSYNNMETSKLLLYDNAVLPLTRRLYAELTNFLMPRYKNSEDLILAFNEKDIPALEPRRNAQAKLKTELNIFTKNEVRNDYGVDGLQGGNQVYEPMSNVAVAVDTSDPLGIALSSPKDDISGSSEDGGVKPVGRVADADEGDGEHPSVTEAQKATKDKFISTLRLQVNKDGTQRFTDDEINELVGRHYGNG